MDLISMVAHIMIYCKCLFLYLPAPPECNLHLCYLPSYSQQLKSIRWMNAGAFEPWLCYKARCSQTPLGGAGQNPRLEVSEISMRKTQGQCSWKQWLWGNREPGLDREESLTVIHFGRNLSWSHGALQTWSEPSHCPNRGKGVGHLYRHIYYSMD